ncbi:MAG: type II toxin-antitoxin system VapC family toxin [Coriobacteriia bacterium]|nr:type II toxin-antitoxin system VapC family toxin [Coriobacteriia bacterium]
MRILLDTSVLLHTAEGNLPKTAENLLTEDGNTAYFSIVNLWEIMIKIMASKLDMSYPLESFTNDLLIRGYKLLDVKPAHIYSLPSLSDMHKDPFDRLLVAQAITEKLLFLTSDSKIAGFKDDHGVRLGFDCSYYRQTSNP